MDHVDLAGEAIGRVSKPTWWLLRRMEQYVNAAIDQHVRLVDAKASMTALLGPALELDESAQAELRRITFQRIADAHFYAICGDQVRRLFERLRSVPEPLPSSVRVLWRSRKSRLESFRTMRNLLEHADKEIVRGVEAGAGLSDTHFNFASYTLDISEQSLDLLADTWVQLMDAVRTMPLSATDAVDK